MTGNICTSINKRKAFQRNGLQNYYYTNNNLIAKEWKNWFRLPCADIVGHLFNGFSLLLQLLRHVLQILFVVPVCIIQKLVAG